MRLRIPRRHLKFVPVVIFSLLSLSLLFARMAHLGNTRFAFMGWNLFLAWLPLLWAELLRGGLRKRRWLSLGNVIYSFLWLAFLPNSFYLITDFIHLRSVAVSTVLFDSVMFMSFAVAGVLLGCMSVYMIHQQLAKRLARDMTWAFLLAFFGLSSFAIYLGRFLGWNSWDLIVNPFYIFLDLSDRLTNTAGLSVTVSASVLFFAFITVSYVAFYSAIKALRTR